MPGRSHDSLRKEPHIRKLLIDKLKPTDGDVLIVGSAEDERTAELAAKNAALLTVMDHEKHF